MCGPEFKPTGALPGGLSTTLASSEGSGAPGYSMHFVDPPEELNGYLRHTLGEDGARRFRELLAKEGLSMNMSNYRGHNGQTRVIPDFDVAPGAPAGAYMDKYPTISALGDAFRLLNQPKGFLMYGYPEDRTHYSPTPQFPDPPVGQDEKDSVNEFQQRMMDTQLRPKRRRDI